MSTITKVLLCAVVVAVSFAIGRWTSPEVVKVETKIVEVEKKVTDQDKRRTRTTVIVKKPDGETTTTTTTQTDTKTKTTTDSTTATDTSSTTKSGTSSKVAVSALAGLDLSTKAPVFGASVQKPILGPLTIGGWGLSNASFGVSVGLSF